MMFVYVATGGAIIMQATVTRRVARIGLIQQIYTSIGIAILTKVW